VGSSGVPGVSWKGVGVGVGERDEREKREQHWIRSKIVYAPAMHSLQTEKDKQTERERSMGLAWPRMLLLTYARDEAKETSCRWLTSIGLSPSSYKSYQPKWHCS
jgi:hypothetical protein